MFCKINRMLSLMILALIGAFFFHSMHLFIDQLLRPSIYAANSAPWHTAVLVNGLLIALIILALLAFKFLMHALGKKTDT